VTQPLAFGDCTVFFLGAFCFLFYVCFSTHLPLDGWMDGWKWNDERVGRESNVPLQLGSASLFSPIRVHCSADLWGLAVWRVD
jgi:hypothetical protein